MNYYNEIKNKIIDTEIYSKIKDYSKERYKVRTYLEIGKLLNEANSKYGENIIEKYSEKLIIEVGKKYNKRTLYRMKQLYLIFCNEKVSALSTQLTWSHYCEILTLKNEFEIRYYLEICIKYNLSTRELRTKIKNKEYDRLDDSIKENILMKNNLKVTDLIKNPIIINTKHNHNQISEKILKQLILEDLDNFLKELGASFSYVGNEYKIKIGDRYNYIDILLYNIEFNCYVVVELKITELKSEHIGQIEKYMNYIDKNIKRITDHKTIGIIICKKDNKIILEYCSDTRIFETTYQLKSL